MGVGFSLIPILMLYGAYCEQCTVTLIKRITQVRQVVKLYCYNLEYNAVILLVRTKTLETT